MANKVLIVDDEAMIREVLSEFAEFEGFEPYQATDGMDAVNKCKQNDCSYLITRTGFCKLVIFMFDKKLSIFWIKQPTDWNKKGKNG